MTSAATLLPLLKLEIGITATTFDGRLTAYLENAQAQIQREGITLQSTSEDDLLTINYAAWTWRKRTTGEGMPRMLRYALNNRLFSEKAGAT